MIFLNISVLVVLLSIYVRKSLFTPTFLLVMPYLFIILINNLMMNSIGYKKIGVSTYKTLLLFACCIFISEIIFEEFYRKYKVTFNGSTGVLNVEDGLIDRLITIIWLIVFIRIINIAFVVIEVGASAIYANDFVNLQLSGIIGHIVLIGMILTTFVFRDYLLTKSKRELAVIIAYTSILFASFIKYHVIIFILCLFFEYCCIYPKKITKAIIGFFGIIVLLFIGNYWISFLLRSIYLSPMFTVTKLWTYVAGGTITHDVINNGYHGDYSISQWFASTFGGLINSITYLISGKAMLIDRSSWGYIIVGNGIGGAYATNVYSFLTYLSQFSSIIERIIASFIVGFTAEISIHNCRKIEENAVRPTSIYVLTFIFLNFFSNYFTLSTAWELLMWSLLSPILLSVAKYFPRMNRIKISLRNNRIRI